MAYLRLIGQATHAWPRDVIPRAPIFEREYWMVVALRRRKLIMLNSKNAYFHQECWIWETPPGPSSRPRIQVIVDAYLCSQGSDQFMNWIGIDNQFNSIQHELNWNWIERFWIGIELELKAWTDRNWSIQSIHFQFNSSSYEVKHFFVCHMEIVVWQAIPCKQAYPHAPLCSQYGVCRGLLT